jgi:serine/threonine-protein kinase
MIGNVLGRYRILEEIGAGGMGVVYRAHDDKLDRDVAVKVLPAGTLTDENARRNFRKEALLLSKLNHPNIETVHDFDTEGGVDFLVMELVPGETLDAKLESGPLTEKEFARLGVQLAQGLVSAHDAGVVHRDLKPANLRVTPDGRLKILDFGLAKLLESVREPSPGGNSGVTSTTLALSGENSAAAGTLPYMAPEQLRGEKVDARCDLYAAGVVLFEMATGRRPFADAQAPRLIAAILEQPPPTPSSLRRGLAPGFERIVLKALEKDPDHRYQSARDLRVDLERLAAPSIVVPPPPTPRRLRRAAGVAAAIAALLLVSLEVLPRILPKPPQTIHALAVLPLANLSGDPAEEYFADGMTEELITNLAKIGALRVISRTSVMGYKGGKKSLPEIARELHVDAVVAGAVARAGDRVRITAQLIDAATDRHLWADTYERTTRDVLALQDEVSRAIARQIRVKLTPDEQVGLASARAVNPEAHEAYLRGRYYADQETDAGFKKAVTSFERAIAIDPSYAGAHAGLAQSYFWASSIFMSASEAMPQARAAAEKALELDPNLASAYVARGYVTSFYDWKWVAGEVDFKHAIALEPGNAVAHQMYGVYLTATRRFDESIAELRHAHDLDPLSTFVEVVSLFPLYESRRYDEAIAAAQKILETSPDQWNARLVLGQAYIGKEEYSRAIEVLGHGERPELRAWSGIAYARSGNRKQAMKVIQEFLSRPDDLEKHAAQLAMVYLALGDKDRVFEWLEKGAEQRSEWVLSACIDPLVESLLSSDPRYAILVRRVGLQAH